LVAPHVYDVTLTFVLKVEAPARAGAIAPVDVIIPAQNTGLGPEKTSFFQALAIPTKISRGTIEIIVRTFFFCDTCVIFSIAGHEAIVRSIRLDDRSKSSDLPSHIGLPACPGWKFIVRHLNALTNKVHHVTGRKSDLIASQKGVLTCCAFTIAAESVKYLLVDSNLGFCSVVDRNGFEMIEKLGHFGQNVRKFPLMNTVTASFDTTV